MEWELEGLEFKAKKAKGYFKAFGACIKIKLYLNQPPLDMDPFEKNLTLLMRTVVHHRKFRPVPTFWEDIKKDLFPMWPADMAQHWTGLVLASRRRYLKHHPDAPRLFESPSFLTELVDFLIEAKFIHKPLKAGEGEEQLDVGLQEKWQQARNQFKAHLKGRDLSFLLSRQVFQETWILKASEDSGNFEDVASSSESASGVTAASTIGLGSLSSPLHESTLITATDSVRSVSSSPCTSPRGFADEEPTLIIVDDLCQTITGALESANKIRSRLIEKGKLDIQPHNLQATEPQVNIGRLGKLEDNSKVIGAREQLSHNHKDLMEICNAKFDLQVKTIKNLEGQINDLTRYVSGYEERFRSQEQRIKALEELLKSIGVV